MVTNPNWQETDQLAIYKRGRGVERTNPASGRAEGLNPGPPDYKTSALNHSVTLPPLKFCAKVHLKDQYHMNQSGDEFS